MSYNFRNLNWLSTLELKCPLDESSQEVRDLLNDSIHDILEVDGKMAPQDKLDCIVRYQNEDIFNFNSFVIVLANPSSSSQIQFNTVYERHQCECRIRSLNS